MAEITMPKMSDTMEEGRVVKWLKKPGDEIIEGEPIAEIETDKANVEMEAFQPGIMRNILVPAGETVPVGEAIAEFDTPEAVQTARPEVPRAAVRQEIPAPAAPQPTTPPSVEAATLSAKPAETPSESRIAASPLARRIAQEHGIDLSTLKGNGPDGRIVESDINDFLTKKPTAPRKPAVEATPKVCPVLFSEEVEEPLSKMRKTIAERMTHSKHLTPHFDMTMEIEMDWAWRVRAELNADEGQPKISFTDMIVKACALALEKYPRVNSSFDKDKLILHKDINIGIAVALEDGLLAPVVHNANKKPLREIAQYDKELARRARTNELHQSDYVGATFTVTNLGMFDVESFAAIINPPESGILAVGAIREIPVISDGQVKSSRRMKVTLSGDHRVLDGAEAAVFLQEVKRRLEAPIGLL